MVTHLNDYVIKPNGGFIDSQENIEIEFRLLKFSPEENNFAKNMFLVVFAPNNQTGLYTDFQSFF